MTQHIDCSEIIELIPDYAFGLADEETARRVEAALPSCPDAARHLADYRRAQAAMRAHVPQIAPPLSLAEKLRAAIQSETAAPVPEAIQPPPPAPAPPQPIVLPVKRKHRSDPPPTAPALSVRPQTPPAPPPARTQTLPVTPPAPRTVERPPTTERPPASPPRDSTDAPKPETESARRSWLPLIAAVAVIALVASNLYWFQRLNGSDGQPSAEGQAFLVRDASSLKWARLEGMAGDYAAILMWDDTSKTGLVYTRGMPQPDEGKVYQLWLLNDTRRVSGGTFTVTPEGDGTLIFTVPDTISSYDAAGITEEPVGGSEEPTSAPMCSGQL